MEPTETASWTVERAGVAVGAAPATLALAHLASAPLAGGARFALGDADEVVIGRGALLRATRTRHAELRQLQLTIDDEWVSRRHAALTRRASHWEVRDLGSKNGTSVNGAPVKAAPLADGDVLGIGRGFWVFRDNAAHAAHELAEELDVIAGPALEDDGLRTLSLPLGAAFRQLRRVAATPLSIVVTGETGTGKDLVARAIHRASGRPGAFVAVNCAALPRTLIEAELFGARRGAYTGATEDRVGLVRAADGGTLFLDEIGDMPVEAQAVLLRVLEEREVVPVGATQAVKVDFRVVAATHRDLDAMVAAGEFRRDLLARLRGFTLELPRLAERREDLGDFLAAALRRAAPDGASDLTLDRDLAAWMFTHPWPGNVRELMQVVATLRALAPGDELRAQDLPAVEQARDTIVGFELPADAASTGAPADVTDDARRDELSRLLERHRGNTAAVARALGTSRSQVRRLARRFGFDLARFRG